MRLAALEIFTVAPPDPGMGGRYWIFPRLTTACGIVGYGECYASTVGPVAMRAVIEDVFARYGGEEFAMIRPLGCSRFLSFGSVSTR